MENKDLNFNTLWEEFLSLGEKYRDSMSIPEFGHALILFTTRMLMDSAPSTKEAKELIEYAMKEGYIWSKKEEKNNEK